MKGRIQLAFQAKPLFHLVSLLSTCLVHTRHVDCTKSTTETKTRPCPGGCPDQHHISGRPGNHGASHPGHGPKKTISAMVKNMVYVVYVAWSSIPKWNPSGTQMPIKGMMTIQQYGQFTPRFDRVICTPSCMCAQQHGRASQTEYGNFIKIFPGPAAGTFHPNSEVSLECLHCAHCSTSLASQIVVISKI